MAEGALGDPMEFGAPYFQDTCDDSDAPAAGPVADSTHLLGFSGEILLHILSHVPSTDLVLNVRRTCRASRAVLGQEPHPHGAAAEGL